MGTAIKIRLSIAMVMLGLLTGLVVPLVSNFHPIKKVLGTSLRNALDRFRQGVDEVMVEFVRAESLGVNYTQMAISLFVMASSVLTLYYIPRKALDTMVPALFFALNLLMICIVIGLVFVLQSFALKPSRLYIRLILVYMPQDRKLLPLLNKNLESHSLKNLHSNLLYCVTVCFLIFQATNFMALYSFNAQMLSMLFGGQITLSHID